ncbi:amino acid ABC transporter permease [Devosia rhodophyticola]|uniref:Amino acid ABC transporter permease n=1 Tax=Devosia rhodophyticola TaxID=3026423 RepID=A0ABY7Z237_9HYPH|nr:amino acid ABC transporter permease [Devosia rhodophyticola]WDR07606.1 amino acid ABC transporter permease [Devosia rhodophyticola]
MLDFSVVVNRWQDLVYGVGSTLALSCAGIVLALCIGLLGAALQRSSRLIFLVPVRIFVEVIRNTPFLVQIFFLFFALPFIGVRMDPTMTAVIALAINGGAYSIEIIRGGVESIPRGQIEAGAALGLSQFQILGDIVMVPALRAIYPALTSQFILLTLTSSVCSSISANELTHYAQRIESETFRSFEVYFTITGLYLVISWLMMTTLSMLGRRLFSYPNQ